MLFTLFFYSFTYTIFGCFLCLGNSHSNNKTYVYPYSVTMTNKISKSQYCALPEKYIYLCFDYFIFKITLKLRVNATGFTF
jgi:hypothetical protein